MAIGSGTDEETTLFERLAAPRSLGRQLLVGLVYTPGRSAAITFVIGSYLWLLWYVLTMAFGLHADPIVAGDWLTLVFTTYALLAALALAQRILAVGINELTQAYLVDIVALTWLTGFYFVWMMARESVSETTTLESLYGPVLADHPGAQVGAVIVGMSALGTVGLIYRSGDETQLFGSELRTALVTLPGVVTAAILLLGPEADSVIWPIVGGVFVGTALGGLLHIQQVVSWMAKGTFAVCSLAMWSIGALGWVVVYRERPPNDELILEHIRFDRPESTDSATESVTTADATDDDE